MASPQDQVQALRREFARARLERQRRLQELRGELRQNLIDSRAERADTLTGRATHAESRSRPPQEEPAPRTPAPVSEAFELAPVPAPRPEPEPEPVVEPPTPEASLAMIETAQEEPTELRQEYDQARADRRRRISELREEVRVQLSENRQARARTESPGQEDEVLELRDEVIELPPFPKPPATLVDVIPAPQPEPTPLVVEAALEPEPTPAPVPTPEPEAFEAAPVPAPEPPAPAFASPEPTLIRTPVPEPVVSEPEPMPAPASVPEPETFDSAPVPAPVVESPTPVAPEAPKMSEPAQEVTAGSNDEYEQARRERRRRLFELRDEVRATLSESRQARVRVGSLQDQDDEVLELRDDEIELVPEPTQEDTEPFETRHPRVRSMPEVPQGNLQCNHCDAVSPGGAVFCPNCGEPMTDVERWLEQAREFLDAKES